MGLLVEAASGHAWGRAWGIDTIHGTGLETAHHTLKIVFNPCLGGGGK